MLKVFLFCLAACFRIFTLCLCAETCAALAAAAQTMKIKEFRNHDVGEYANRWGSDMQEWNGALKHDKREKKDKWSFQGKRGENKGLFVPQKDVRGVRQRSEAWEEDEDDGGVVINLWDGRHSRTTWA